MSRLIEVAVPLPLHDSFTYVVPDELAEALGIGARVQVPFGRRKLVGYVVGFLESTELKRVKEITAVLDEPPLLTSKLLELGRWMASYYACSLGESLRAILPTGARRVRGERRGRRAEQSDDMGLAGPQPPHELNRWQQQVLAPIEERIDRGGFEAFLLHGVTGSGKTEVYLRAVHSTLERGRAAVILIPEIALTPQTADRFRSRLGTELGILHSGMTLAERHDVMTAAARGEIQVVLGARSAIFAPFRNLGLVVVDEEQEPSYKQGEKPRYHARSVALMRGSFEGAAVLLGTATPSLESYHNVARHKHTLLRIPERVDRRPLARVEIVDMRAEENRRTVLSPVLSDALAQRLELGEQSILLLNRRGHSNYLQCLGCGELVRCPYCDISLTYHAVGQNLRCHYCNHARAVPRECPQCSNPCQLLRGVGTQRLEQDLAGLLPSARLRRMDLDTTARRGAHRAILEEFARGDVDILFGTQMVAKGHDFPSVTLVGVVQADGGLSLPDFRAAERTFQLLAQVAGRAGRGERPGDVYIQTLSPDHYSVALAAAQDYEGFYERESVLRHDLGYPPFARLVGVTGLGPDRARLSRSMQELSRGLRAACAGQAIQVLGPAPSPIPRLRGRFREQLLIKGALGSEGKARLLREVAARDAPGVDFQVDVDPVNML
jgi:primosomal protein N' (replication factor Y)